MLLKAEKLLFCVKVLGRLLKGLLSCIDAAHKANDGAVAIL